MAKNTTCEMLYRRWTVCAELRSVKMAISQRLVDPYRQIRVPISYRWQELYQAALLETDWTKMQERVETAESEIHKRRLVLAQDHGGTGEERAALVNAMSGLRVLRMNVASWLERQNLGGTLPTKLRSQISNRTMNNCTRQSKRRVDERGF